MINTLTAEMHVYWSDPVTHLIISSNNVSRVELLLV